MDVEANNATNPAIHGLRGTGILRTYSLGYEVDQIANAASAVRARGWLERGARP
jgi:hypothetical protein